MFYKLFCRIGLLFFISFAAITVHAEEKKIFDYTYGLLPPDIIDVYFPFGRLYEIPNNEKTDDLIKKALDYEKKGDLRRAYRYYNYAIGRTKNSAIIPYILFKKAYTLTDERIFIKELKNIIERYPDFPLNDAVRFEIALNLYIKSLYNPQQIDEHTDSYIYQILKNRNSPFYPYALTLQGDIYLQKNKYQDAINNFIDSISALKEVKAGSKYEAQFMNNYFGIAKAYLNTKNYDAAEIILRKILGTSRINRVKARALYYLYSLFERENNVDNMFCCYVVLKRDFPNSIYLFKIREDHKSKDFKQESNLCNRLNLGIEDRNLLGGVDNIAGLTKLQKSTVYENKNGKANLKSRNKYSIQVGSFKTELNAKKMMLKISKLGFPCYVKSVKKDGVLYLRVKVGPYKTKDEALNILKNLKSQGITGFLIKDE